MKIEALGPGCQKCTALAANIEAATRRVDAPCRADHERKIKAYSKNSWMCMRVARRARCGTFTPWKTTIQTGCLPEFLFITAFLVLPGCVPVSDKPVDGHLLVNLQITEDEDAGAIEAFMAELDAREILATLIVDEYLATEACDELRRYDEAGHEIMVYGRPEESPGETVTLTMLSYKEQEEVIARAKSAIEDCLGHAVDGFRSYRFAHNEDTWRILDALGFEYNLSFVAQSSNSLAGHTEDEWPYEVQGHDFWAVPMHSADFAGQTRAFCDMPFSSLSAEDWEALLKSEVMRMQEMGLPLKVEFHPYFSANDDGRWNAFLAFIDYARAQGAEFMTIEQMMEQMPAS